MSRLGAILSIACLVTLACAEPPFLEVVKAKYHAGTCQTCHTSPPVRNPFGQAVEAAMRQASVRKVNEDVLQQVETQDTDGDGVSNGDELRAGTSPGDPRSGVQKSALSRIVPDHAFHPLVVHFPIALFLFGVFLDVLGAKRQDSALRKFALWNLGFGAVGSIGAVFTGVSSFLLRGFAFEGVPLVHFVLGLSTCILMCAGALMKRRNPEAGGLYWLVVALAVTSVTVGGHLGMTLVYG